MRLLVVHPGASWSTADVWRGLVAALQRRGHEIIRYNLDGRMDTSSSWLMYQWRRAGKPNPKPGWPDVAYLASHEVPYRAIRTGADWVLVVSAMYLHPDALRLCKRAGIKVGLLFTESPYDDEEQARIAEYADICWTNERTSVSRLAQANPNVYYLPHAYDPERHRPDLPVDPDVPEHDVVFVGTGFEERIELLSAVDWTNIDLGLYGTWGMLGSRHKLRRYVREGPISNDRTAMLYRRARIGLNLYRTSRGFGRGVDHIEHAESLNPRALELAACGVFHLSDYRAEVEEVFGDLVPTFHNSTELEQLIRRYLADEASRKRTARLLPDCVATRSFDAMAKQIEEKLVERRN